jgi:hypothetical protein
VLSSRGLAVVVVGRDPTMPYPEGCGLGPAGFEESSSEGAVAAGDPFTHRPLLEALKGQACGGMVMPLPGYRLDPG